MELNHESRLSRVEERAKSNTHRLDEVEKRQDNLENLTVSVKVLAEREERMEKDVGEIKNDVKTLTGKSGKKWDNLMNSILVAVVSAIVGFVLAKIGF